MSPTSRFGAGQQAVDCGCTEGAIAASIALLAWPAWAIRAARRRQLSRGQIVGLYPAVVVSAALLGKTGGLAAAAVRRSRQIP